jgi:hypothetical protein
VMFPWPGKHVDYLCCWLSPENVDGCNGNVYPGLATMLTYCAVD